MSAENEFYNTAKDVARIIREKSYDDHHIVEVMLYGSTLRNKSPRDIDLLIIHEGSNLKTFSPYSRLIFDNAVTKDENARDSAFLIFKNLGYKTQKEDSVLNAVCNRVSKIDIETLAKEEISETDKTWRGRYKREYTKEWIESWRISPTDILKINAIFDVNVLHSRILKPYPGYDPNGILDPEHHLEVFHSLKKEAIKRCRDPTFWYTILSEGRIYDLDKNDFSLKVEDKYPEALSFFPSK